MENKIKMVARIAGEEVYVGECNSARARILVKQNYASWHEGKILLHILNVHDTLLATNPILGQGPLDDENVSKQEIERRMAWFRSVLQKTSVMLSPDRHIRPLPSVEEAREWFNQNEEGDPNISPELNSEITEFDYFFEDSNLPIEDGLLSDIWDPCVDVSNIWQQYTSHDNPASGLTAPEQEPVVVATLTQILHHKYSGSSTSEQDRIKATVRKAKSAPATTQPVKQVLWDIEFGLE